MQKAWLVCVAVSVVGSRELVLSTGKMRDIVYVLRHCRRVVADPPSQNDMNSASFSGSIYVYYGK